MALRLHQNCVREGDEYSPVLPRFLAHERRVYRDLQDIIVYR